MSKTEKFREGTRITLAITAKDIVDGIKNKNTVTILVTAIFIVIFYRFVTTIRLGNGLPNVIVYDAGSSSLALELDRNRSLNFYIFGSQTVMEEKLSKGGDAREIGLVLPFGIDEAITSTEPVALDGYVLNWATENDVTETLTAAEEEITALVGRPVEIDVEGNVIYAQPDSYGHPFVTSIAFVFVTLMIGTTLTPNLMIEEKRTRALDALMVSPASSSQIVLGKALTGIIYCFLGSVFVLLINYVLVVHWGLLILVALVGTFACVALGLLLGTIFEVRQQLTLWGFILLQPLAIPMFLQILTDILPDWLITVFNWIPTVAFMRVVRLSFSERAPISSWGGPFVIILGFGVVITAVVIWLVRRADV
jgi:ABC-2 type transport system permease protein